MLDFEQLQNSCTPRSRRPTARASGGWSARSASATPGWCSASRSPGSRGNPSLRLAACNRVHAPHRIRTSAGTSDDRNRIYAPHTLGCGVALDDFGTGFASLTYLKRLKVTELRIDREFVGAASESEADQQVINTIVSIGRNFRLRTVAEGIEDEATRELLDRMGVDLAQGYLFGRPRILGRASDGRA